MDNNKDLLQIMKRAKYVATKCGYPQHAEDFAQEAAIALHTTGYANLEWIFTDFLRNEYGCRRTLKGAIKSFVNHTRVSYDAPVGTEEDGLRYCDIIGSGDTEPQIDPGIERFASSYSGADAHVFERYFLDNETEKQTGREIGVSECRISQRVSALRKDLKDKLESEEALVRYTLEDNFGVFRIDWLEV